MARIRTVKPELFKHEELYDLEVETGLPIRLAWIGLFAIADREGRFKVRPRAIKSEIMPFDKSDFSRVLYALQSRGFLVAYTKSDELFACIPNFLKHQVINNKEKASILPGPNSEGVSVVNSLDDLLTREARVDDALPAELFPTLGEGKGKEGKGTRKGKGVPAAQAPAAPVNVVLNSEIWKAYSDAYFLRYNTEPVRNRTVNSQIKSLGERLGSEAPDVARFYVSMNKAFYVSATHAIGICLKDAESIRTQWATGNVVSNREAQSADQSLAFQEQLKRIRGEK